MFQWRKRIDHYLFSSIQIASKKMKKLKPLKSSKFWVKSIPYLATRKNVNCTTRVVRLDIIYVLWPCVSLWYFISISLEYEIIGAPFSVTEDKLQIIYRIRRLFKNIFSKNLHDYLILVLILTMWIPVHNFVKYISFSYSLIWDNIVNFYSKYS